MKIISFLKKLIVDIVTPEETRVQKLLNIPPETMLALLPKSKVSMNNIHILFDYQSKLVKLIVKSIKYKNNQNLKKRIASYFYEEIITLSEDIALFDGSPPIIIPMPMSKNERRTRGFNQCEEICREIEKLGNKDIQISYNILKKVKETKRQTSLGREERMLNVGNSMQVYENSNIKNRTVIVLDDVYTTLSSFREAERALKDSEAKRVIGLFIAH